MVKIQIDLTEEQNKIITLYKVLNNLMTKEIALKMFINEYGKKYIEKINSPKKI